MQENYVALVGSELDHLVGTLDLFKVPYRVNPSDNEQHAVTMFYRQYPCALGGSGGVRFCIPSRTKEFDKFLQGMGIESRCIRKPVWLKLTLRDKGCMRFRVSNMYQFSSSVEVLAASTQFPLLVQVPGKNVALFSVDLVEEVSQLFDNHLNLHPSLFFKLCSNLSLASIVPRGLGNTILRLSANANTSAESYLKHLNLLDGLRYLLLAAIVISAGMPIKALWFWPKNRRYAAVITHDVDTKYGFNTGISLLRAVERKYGVKSAWNISTGQYPIKREVIRSLVSEGCEIGSHSYHHDGRLILSNNGKVAEALRESKLMLTQLSQCEVGGFRSPLLQHSEEVLKAVKEAGFIYDSSIPAWEAHCRTTGKPHGIGTVYPLSLWEGLVELPVTLPQDHQLRYLGGLSPKEILELWRNLMAHIKSIGGLCNMIVHPDKELFGSQRMTSWYEKVVKEVTEDTDCWLTMPSEIAEWWRFRERMNVGNNAYFPLAQGGFGEVGSIEYTSDSFVLE